MKAILKLVFKQPLNTADLRSLVRMGFHGVATQYAHHFYTFEHDHSQMSKYEFYAAKRVVYRGR